MYLRAGRGSHTCKQESVEGIGFLDAKSSFYSSISSNKAITKKASLVNSNYHPDSCYITRVHLGDHQTKVLFIKHVSRQQSSSIVICRHCRPSIRHTAPSISY